MRSQGVQVPQSQRRSGKRSEPNRVLNALPAALVAVEYSNEQGIVIKEFWYKVGEVFYLPPNAEQFASELRPAKSIFVEQVHAKLATQAGTPLTGLPSQDAVDVVSDQTAAQSSGGIET